MYTQFTFVIVFKLTIIICFTNKVLSFRLFDKKVLFVIILPNEWIESIIPTKKMTITYIFFIFFTWIVSFFFIFLTWIVAKRHSLFTKMFFFFVSLLLHFSYVTAENFQIFQLSLNKHIIKRVFVLLFILSKILKNLSSEYHNIM